VRDSIAAHDAGRCECGRSSLDVARELGVGHPPPAARRALEHAGIAVDGIDAFKTHNPFALNDIVFARALGLDVAKLDNYGSSLVWGHPQAPMGTRSIIELIEELALRGGGRGLFAGCAAGESAVAVVLEVTDAHV
jgi:acetyl-CoA acetyltransferase